MYGGVIFLIALSASFLLDTVALPAAVPPWRRGMVALATHITSVATVFLLTLSISGRPAFAGFVAASLVGLLAVVSNAKHQSLREPLVFSDLSLFSQLFRHPRMYLPFLSVANTLALLAGAGVFGAVLVYSRPMPEVPYAWLLAATAAGALCNLLAARVLRLTMVPALDQRKHGFYTVFVACLMNGLRPATGKALRAAMARGPFSRKAQAAQRPDVIVVQSESFFDARCLGPGVRTDLLANFDAACASAVHCGQLDVPAWGANTMRTEFAVLSGLAPSEQGYARFYPYAYVRRQCTSLAAWFRSGGYRTVAIHPYHGDFFGRWRVFRMMHFERFLDIRHFKDAPRFGPYVADSAVTEAIRTELEAAGDKPAFVLAMTIENHGPLHLESVAPGESAGYQQFGEGKAWDDLTVYLRHLANADAMIGELTRYLASRKRPAVLCFYGDHVPALSKVYGQLRCMPQQSSYFIWRSDRVATTAPATEIAPAHRLGQMLIDCLGATPVEAVSSKALADNLASGMGYAPH